MYIKKQTFIILLATILLLALAAVLPVLAGNTDSPGLPENTSSYTLQDIYARLTSGTAGSQSTFTEPSSGPGSTMADLNTIMAAAPALDATNGATTANVASGKTFWGLTSGQWGLQTGTATISAYPAVLPKTWQTTSYATGDDGDLEKGVAWPSPRFTDNGNGTVTDNLTGLMWIKNADAGNDCAGADTGRETWANALASAAACNNDGGYAGYTDWRLPNAREMLSLIDYGRFNPALPSSHPFAGVRSFTYWTGTTYAGLTTYAWDVNLYDGLLSYDDKTLKTYYVWPVRGGTP